VPAVAREQQPAPGEDAAPRAGPREALRLIASRSFGPYFVGNAVSASGTWVQNLAAALLIYRQTHSAFLLGVLNFCQFVPVLLLVPWTGKAADRFDRRRLLLVTQPLAAALSGLLALLAWHGLASTAIVIADAAAIGVTSAFSAPTQQALVTGLVEPRDIPSAVGLNSMTFNIARAAGPTLATASVTTLGIPASFAINAASFGLFAAILLVVRPRRQERAERGAARFRESLGLLRREPRLAVLLAIVVVVGAASDPVNTLSPAFAHAFGHRDVVAGFVVGSFGAGAVLAAFLLAGRIGGSRRRMTATLALFGAGMIAFSLSPWFAVGLVLLVVAGFGYLASNTAATARLQLSVEETQRGRMMALWSVAFLGLRPLASIADGAIASAVGVRAAGVALGCLPLVAAALLLRGTRSPATGTSAAPATAAAADRSRAARER
jgi:MFS family permease